MVGSSPEVLVIDMKSKYCVAVTDTAWGWQSQIMKSGVIAIIYCISIYLTEWFKICWAQKVKVFDLKYSSFRSFCRLLYSAARGGRTTLPPRRRWWLTVLWDSVIRACYFHIQDRLFNSQHPLHPILLRASTVTWITQCNALPHASGHRRRLLAGHRLAALAK
jgi:hypothetical protein